MPRSPIEAFHITHMKKLSCLIVDDSIIYRSQVATALKKLPFIQETVSATNGRHAIKKMKLQKFDLVVLDLEMPELDGIDTLKQLKELRLETSVIMFASATERSAKATIEALNLGAKDFVLKPGADRAEGERPQKPEEKIKNLLQPKIEALFPECSKPTDVNASVSAKSYPKVRWSLLRPKIVVIGASTGGPTALEAVFQNLQPPFSCPIVITQHMPPVFTKSFADRLGKVVGIETHEASNGQEFKANNIYVAPGGFHLRIGGTASKPVAAIEKGELINSIRPAVDPLFETAANLYRNQCLGFVLTGMGSDGAEGARHIKERGGAMVIQEKESCAVWGMPAMVHKIGAFDKMATLEEISQLINELAGGLSLSKKAV